MADTDEHEVYIFEESEEPSTAELAPTVEPAPTLLVEISPRRKRSPQPPE